TLADLRRHIDRTFDDSDPAVGNCAAPADVMETADELQFVLEVPGMRAQDIELTVENGVLTVAAEKQPAPGRDSTGVTFRLAERRFGRFVRQFRLPRTADAGAIQAACTDGLLTIRVPRVEAAKARRIEVSGTVAPAGTSQE
ncbi:MAG: Hsp20/alpha crystallin family protein, partial [Gemmatimonadetes bacterium]|nr:Hsp20/alpha crystallin family protein [Gemmatimonadota bacterium]